MVITANTQQKFNGDRIYELFCQRLQSGWLIDRDGRDAIDLADRQLAQLDRDRPKFISIATLEPIEFIATLMAGLRLGIPLFIGNPYWGATEWQQVSKLTERVDRQQHQHLIMIPTGGSSGDIKFAIHTWETLSASVWGFQDFYELEPINCMCTLPFYHVSGLMQLWRSLLTDGQLFIIDFDRLKQQADRVLDLIDINRYFISLVPTQLSKLLDLNLTDRLAKFNTILIGGAPPSLELLTRARIARLPLALTYGMTETASQIASLKPAEFLVGHNSCGRVLPHVEIRLNSSPDRSIGSMQISAKSLMLGYFPNLDSPTYFEPDDLGGYDRYGYLKIFGRSSNKIITGGENVYPVEVVDAIMATRLVADAWVMGLPDPYWGQIVTAIYVEKDRPVSGEILARAIGGKISKYKIPKQWFAVDLIPRNELGKVLTQAVEISIGWRSI